MNMEVDDTSDDDVKTENPSEVLLQNLPDFCKEPRYQSYFRQFDQMKRWFNQYADRGPSQHALQSDPLYQQYARSQAWSSSYWVYYHYCSMMGWYHKLQQASYQPNQYYQSKLEADRRAMPPPYFTPRRPCAGRQMSETSPSSDGVSERKRSRQHTQHAEQNSIKDHVTDIVLDLDPSVLKEEEEVIECHMEITDEMLEFFAQSARHRQERDAQKSKEEEEGKKDQYIDITKAHSAAARASTAAPTERPGLKRTEEMKLLYGGGAAMIHGMETAMQLTYDRYVDVSRPKLWPHLPLNIKFE